LHHFEVDFSKGIAGTHQIFFAAADLLFQQSHFRRRVGLRGQVLLAELVVQNEEDQHDGAEAARHHVEEGQAHGTEGAASLSTHRRPVP
jgi:hypothetical protein